MTRFKHISRPDELIVVLPVVLEPLLDPWVPLQDDGPETVYRWERAPVTKVMSLLSAAALGPWREKYWSFALFIKRPTVMSVGVELKMLIHRGWPNQDHRAVQMFDNLDEAERYVQRELERKWLRGYRPTRKPCPDGSK